MCVFVCVVCVGSLDWGVFNVHTAGVCQMGVYMCVCVRCRVCVCECLCSLFAAKSMSVLVFCELCWCVEVVYRYGVNCAGVWRLCIGTE